MGMSKEGAQDTDALEEAATFVEVLPWHLAGGLHSLTPGTSSSMPHPWPGGSALSHCRSSLTSGFSGPWGSEPRNAVPSLLAPKAPKLILCSQLTLKLLACVTLGKSLSFSLPHFPICTSTTKALCCPGLCGHCSLPCVTARDRCLLNFYIFLWVFGKEQVFFQTTHSLSYLFQGLCWHPVLTQPLFWILTSPLCSSSWLLLCMHSVKSIFLHFSHSPASLSPPVNAPWGDGNHLSCLFGCWWLWNCLFWVDPALSDVWLPSLWLISQ